ncbi:MAG: HNH endonuclease signature motif containing protein [Candidatus Paceibacterota bacterium]
MSKRSWTKEDLINAAAQSKSVRQVLFKLHLVEAGGNYEQVKKYLKLYNVSIPHFTGMTWNKGLRGHYQPQIPLEKILTTENHYQSYQLKNRLFRANLKQCKCEECGWAERSIDGRIPVELDHINGDRHDNRLENLRVLCPNCHSLKPTHRGKNKTKARVVKLVNT